MEWEEMIEEAKRKWNELHGFEPDDPIGPEDANGVLSVADSLMKLESASKAGDAFEAATAILSDRDQDAPPAYAPFIGGLRPGVGMVHGFPAVFDPYSLAQVFDEGTKSLVLVQAENSFEVIVALPGNVRTIAEAVAKREGVVDVRVYEQTYRPVALEPDEEVAEDPPMIPPDDVIREAQARMGDPNRRFRRRQPGPNYVSVRDQKQPETKIPIEGEE